MSCSSYAKQDEDEDDGYDKKPKTSTTHQHSKEPENDINKEMKEKIEGILKEEDRRPENRGEVIEEAEEEELNSDDDVSGGLTRLQRRTGHGQEHTASILREGELNSSRARRTSARFICGTAYFVLRSST